eukprot:jgi/Botrbrau1/10448/Bobra.0133s0055.1
MGQICVRNWKPVQAHVQASRTGLRLARTLRVHTSYAGQYAFHGHFLVSEGIFIWWNSLTICSAATVIPVKQADFHSQMYFASMISKYCCLMTLKPTHNFSVSPREIPTYHP